MAPIGTKVILSDHDRAKWDNKGINSFYIGPVKRHYQNFVCYNPATNKTRTHDTIQWFPHDDSFPFVQGTATTTNLLLMELIATLNGTTVDPSSMNDVPTLIRQVQSLLHKKGMLPRNTPTNDTITTTTTSKGGSKRAKTAKCLQSIMKQMTPCSTPSTTPPPSSVSVIRNHANLWDIISKGSIDQTKQKANKMMHLIGSIVCQKFGLHYFEGEITSY